MITIISRAELQDFLPDGIGTASRAGASTTVTHPFIERYAQKGDMGDFILISINAILKPGVRFTDQRQRTFDYGRFGIWITFLHKHELKFNALFSSLSSQFLLDYRSDKGNGALTKGLNTDMSDFIQGKRCVITGANTGIGKETARELAQLGANVVMVCRNEAKGTSAMEEIIADTGNENVELILADLSSMEQVRTLADTIKDRYDALHVLINNAGLIASNRRPTVDGYEETFAVNHLAPFLLTNLLLDLITASAPARIINVSSSAHWMGKLYFDDLMFQKKYASGKAYAQSKLANILFTRELAKQLNGSLVTVNALMPGVIHSRFGREFQGIAKYGSRLMQRFMLTPVEGAATSIYLATSYEGGVASGEYFNKKKIARISRTARDTEQAKRLWDISTRLTNVK